jgi:hypothetical protein
MNSTSESSASDTNEVSIDQLLRTIRSGLTRVLDDERALAYGQLATFRAAKRNLLARHEKLLTSKLGKNNPRVLALQTQRAAMEAEVPNLQAAHAEAAISVPDVKPTGYALYGFVRTLQREPIPGAVVAVYDTNGKKRADFDSAVTDANGYFEVATSTLVKLGEAPVQPREKSAQKVALDVRIFDGRRRPLKHFLSAIDALPGRVTFREIIVDPNAQPAAVPPDSVARSSPPPSGSKPETKVLAILRQIAEGLRSSRQSGNIRTPSSTRTQKLRAKSQKQQKRPVAPRKKERPKKGKAH